MRHRGLDRGAFTLDSERMVCVSPRLAKIAADQVWQLDGQPIARQARREHHPVDRYIEWLGRFRRLALTEAEQRTLVFVREVGAINIPAYRLPTELDTAVRSLGQRATSEQIRLVIECLYRWRPQTSDQLAQLLGRNEHHLVTSILRPMVKDGRLSLTHPEAPAHPQQAYTARPPGP